MIVYVLAFLSSVTFAGWGNREAMARDGRLVQPRRLTPGAVMVIAVLAGVSALRWRVGTDYWTYDYLYDQYVREFPGNLAITGEPGLPLLAQLSHVVGAESAGMFALAAIITLALLVRTLWRWSPAFALSVAILILSGVWHGTFNGVRQYLACAILFSGHRYVIDRKFIKWSLIVFVASLFHISALVGLLIYLVPARRTSVLIQFFVVVLGVVVMFGFESLLGWIEIATGDAGLSEGSYATRRVNPLRVAFAFVPIALFWLLDNRDAVEKADGWFYINMLAVYAATFLASANSAYLARFAIYSSPFLAIGLVSATSVQNRTERYLIRGALLSIFAVFLYLEIIAASNLVQFQWIFDRE